MQYPISIPYRYSYNFQPIPFITIVIFISIPYRYSYNFYTVKFFNRHFAIFQFLIGILITSIDVNVKGQKTPFQFLIGILITQFY